MKPKLIWISSDPESGYSVATNFHRYKDTGLTLMEEFPEQYFQVPRHAAVLLKIAGWIHGQAMRYCGKWDKP